MFANFEWDPENVPMLKMGIHCLQILLAFVLWCLEIAVFVGDKAEVTGNNGWTFGVVSYQLLFAPVSGIATPEPC